MISVLCSACAVADDGNDEVSEAALAMSDADAAAVLAVVNYPGTDLATLDDAAALDSRAAKAIVAKRNGADGVTPSPDDFEFDLVSLDAVAYVGDTAFGKLRTYALAHPAPAGELVEGVAFRGWESEAVVFGVNHASSAELDSLIDTRASANLIAKRPFASVTAMGPVAYVGSTALGKLRGNARAWWNAAHQPAGFTLTIEALAAITTVMKESLWEDEGFAHLVLDLAAGNDNKATEIMNALEAEIDRLTAPLVGTRYFDADAARESVEIAAPVKQRTKIGGWTYLQSIGVTP